jgi:hypothetical protein
MNLCLCSYCILPISCWSECHMLRLVIVSYKLTAVYSACVHTVFYQVHLLLVRTPYATSSISGKTKSHLRWNDEVELPEMTWNRDRKWRQPCDRNCVMRMRNSFLRFCLTIVVVQSVPLRMTGSSMATGCDVIKRHVIQKGLPLKGEMCACAIGSCTISAILGPFHQKWSHQTSRDPEGVSLEGWDAPMHNRKWEISPY